MSTPSPYRAGRYKVPVDVHLILLRDGPDGRQVLLGATNLVPGTDTSYNAFCTGQEELLSPGQDGKPVTVGGAALSADESTVVFDSYYPGLVPEDTNLIGDVFVRTLS
jgi:hypothetical protein